MMMRTIYLLVFVSFFTNGFAQDFVPRCEGKWEGKMYIWAGRKLIDSVDVRFTVARLDTFPEWSWKTEYLSEKTPVIKDYTLANASPDGRLYSLVEPDGTILPCYLYGNTLYSVFVVDDNLLTSTYRLEDDVLVFEVTSGKKHKIKRNKIQTYSCDFVQRVTLKRVS